MRYGPCGVTIPSVAPTITLSTLNVPNSRSVGFVTTISAGAGAAGTGNGGRGDTTAGGPTIGVSQTYEESPTTGSPFDPGWSSVAEHTDPTRTPACNAGVASVADHVVSIGASVPYWHVIVPVNGRSFGTRPAAGPVTTFTILTSE